MHLTQRYSQPVVASTVPVSVWGRAVVQVYSVVSSVETLVVLIGARVSCWYWCYLTRYSFSCSTCSTVSVERCCYVDDSKQYWTRNLILAYIHQISKCYFNFIHLASVAYLIRCQAGRVQRESQFLLCSLYTWLHEGLLSKFITGDVQCEAVTISFGNEIIAMTSLRSIVIAVKRKLSQILINVALLRHLTNFHRKPL